MRREVKGVNLTDAGLDLVEGHADKRHDATTMMLCQVLREIREIKRFLHQCNYACDGCNNSASGTDNGENKHG